jgi:hypothetical protein
LKLSRQSARDGVPPAPAVPLPHDALLFIDLKARKLELLDHPLRQLLADIVAYVLFKQSTQQGAVAVDRKADVEQQQISERALIHRRHVLMMFWPSTGIAEMGEPVKSRRQPSTSLHQLGRPDARSVASLRSCGYTDGPDRPFLTRHHRWPRIMICAIRSIENIASGRSKRRTANSKDKPYEIHEGAPKNGLKTDYCHFQLIG